jgi:phosphatidylethanolamine-binding protein (PEBP) family uncharacterized protein
MAFRLYSDDLKQGDFLPQAQVFNSFGHSGGNLSPHRHIFTVHALKAPHIEVNPDSSGAMVGFMVTMNTLGSASFTTRYGV